MTLQKALVSVLLMMAFTISAEWAGQAGGGDVAATPPSVAFSKLVEVKGLNALPKSVRSALATITRDSSCPGIADIGQRFNKGDVVERGVPCRGLVFDAQAGELWLVYYQRGGFGLSSHLVLFETEGGKVVNSWSYITPREYHSFQELIAGPELRKECFVSPPREYLAAEDEACYPFRSGT